MRTKQGTHFVSLPYAKKILMQKYINIDTQFLGRAEGSFQDSRSRIKYFAISNKIYDMKTTLNILGDFCFVQFYFCTFGCTSKSQIEIDIEFCGRRDQVTPACLLAKQ